jgi:hypothetical protein
MKTCGCRFFCVCGGFGSISGVWPRKGNYRKREITFEGFNKRKLILLEPMRNVKACGQDHDDIQYLRRITD